MMIKKDGLVSYFDKLKVKFCGVLFKHNWDYQDQTFDVVYNSSHSIPIPSQFKNKSVTLKTRLCRRCLKKQRHNYGRIKGVSWVDCQLNRQEKRDINLNSLLG